MWVIKWYLSDESTIINQQVFALLIVALPGGHVEAAGRVAAEGDWSRILYIILPEGHVGLE